MKNIIEYVGEYGCDNFTTCRITPVDMLILAELSYFELGEYGKPFENSNFEKYISLNKEEIIKDITSPTLDRDNNIELIKAIFNSNRYKNLEMAFYTDKKSNRKVMQYASMVFKLGNSYIITFRGTDMSLLGWQEDLYLSFLDKLPSHDLCVKFVEDSIEKLPLNANIYITGHSKGGNFATYAGSYIAEKYQKRITGIYDFDGPGYKTNIFKCGQFKNIENKYHKIVPYDSIVGTLMIDYSKYKVVNAMGVNGISQHSPFKWELNQINDFVYLPKISKTSRAFDLAFEDWIGKLDDQTKKSYTTSIFNFLAKCGIKDLRQLSSEIFPLFRKAIAEQRSMEKEAKKKAFSSLFELGKLFLYYRFRSNI